MDDINKRVKLQDYVENLNEWADKYNSVYLSDAADCVEAFLYHTEH